MFRKITRFLARLRGISANSNEIYRLYNLQAFANISGKFTTLIWANEMNSEGCLLHSSFCAFTYTALELLLCHVVVDKWLTVIVGWVLEIFYFSITICMAVCLSVFAQVANKRVSNLRCGCCFFSHGVCFAHFEHLYSPFLAQNQPTNKHQNKG